MSEVTVVRDNPDTEVVRVVLPHDRYYIETVEAGNGRMYCEDFELRKAIVQRARDYWAQVKTHRNSRNDCG